MGGSGSKNHAKVSSYSYNTGQAAVAVPPSQVAVKQPTPPPSQVQYQTQPVQQPQYYTPPVQQQQYPPEEKATCAVCNSDLPNYKSLKAHVKEKHPGSPKPVHPSLKYVDPGSIIELFSACRAGELPRVQALLSRVKFNINKAKDEQGNKCFYYAILSGHTQLLSYLFDQGALLDMEDREGQRYASAATKQEILDLIRQRSRRKMKKQNSQPTLYTNSPYATPQPYGTPQPMGYPPQQQPMMMTPTGLMPVPMNAPVLPNGAIMGPNGPMMPMMMGPNGVPVPLPMQYNTPVAPVPAPAPAPTPLQHMVPWQELKLEQKVGEGAFGEVWKGKYRGCAVALKRLRADSLDAHAVREFTGEMNMLSALRHPNIITFMGVSTDPAGLMCLVSEFMQGGSLFDALHKKKVPLNEKTKRRLAKEIARGITFLHSSQPPIIHRDIKSMNILLDEEMEHAKIADLGTARVMRADAVRSRAGTPMWQAPEQLLDQPYNHSVDVYAFGLVLYEIFAGALPFPGYTPAQLKQAVGVEGKRPQITPIVPADIGGMIGVCWQQVANNRPAMDFVVEKLDP